MKNQTIESLIESIRKTSQALLTALIILGLFLVLLVVAALLALARLLPYLVRAASILTWAVSLFVVFVAVSTLYGKFSDAIAAILTAGLMTLLLTVAPMARLANVRGDAIFGEYLLTALVGLGVKLVCDAATPDLYPVASVIPPTLAAMFLIVVVTNKERKNENVRF